jgi:hypothetical protein
MKVSRLHSSLRVAIIVLALGLTLPACSKSSVDGLPNAAGGATATLALAGAVLEADARVATLQPAEVNPRPAATPTAVPTATPTPSPTATPTATPLPMPTAPPEPLQVLNHGFGQEGRSVGLAFILENPNRGFAFERTQYQAVISSESGTVLGTSSGYIALILPGETLGVADRLWLDEGVTASSMEVQLLGNTPFTWEPLPTFGVAESHYIVGTFSRAVTGVVSSPYDMTLTDIQVSAVVYDESGEIVGGGYTFLNFVPAHGSTGARVAVVASETAVRAELYPTISGLTFLSEELDPPEGASNPVLTHQGFGQDASRIGFGFTIENPNRTLAIENAQYRVTAYAEDGRVLETEEGHVRLLLPNQTLGVGGTTSLVEELKVARIETELRVGAFVEIEPRPSFWAEGVTFNAEGFRPRVSGRIASPYPQDVTDVRISAIVYDEAGEIIGGGSTYLGFVPANGCAAFEVSVIIGGDQATTELYTALTSLSDFR